MEHHKCLPTHPKRVGREFIRQYYTIMNKSPENLHCFYSEEASFIHDDLNPSEPRTIVAEGKMEIREIMLERSSNYKHTSTKIHTVETIETLDDGLLVQVNGEISYNEQPMRPFSQTIILIPKSPFQYFVQNDIFRFYDYEMDTSNELASTSREPPMPAQPDWGTQCEEYIEPYEPPRAVQKSQDNMPLEEAKLDTSDSGLSSDAEKVIMDIQSLNLKSILQEPKTLTKETVSKRGPNQSDQTAQASTAKAAAAITEDIKENHSQLFRDSCILTIGNVVNPNIEFEDDAKRLQNASSSTHITPSDNDKTLESSDPHNASKNDEISTGKMKYQKKKNKRKSKQKTENDGFEEKSLDESTEKAESETVVSEAILEQSAISSVSQNAVDKTQTEEPSENRLSLPKEDINAPQSAEETTPKTMPEIKTYADLAKEASKQEWIDELAMKRDSERKKSRPSLTRRNSRIEKTSPPPTTDFIYSNRSSPKNDQLQVFIGNIPHTATEDDIGKMFSRFGRLTRVRLHANNRKDWLPYYAFVTFENIQSAKNCLSKKGTFYWPENSSDRQKLNVNGDPSIDIWDDAGNQRSNENRGRDMRQFGKNFVLNKEDNNKRSPDSDNNVSESMKTERRKRSTRA